ncbi:HAD family hydrolase [Arthrobacter sp. NPDC057013]|uniref:HAD family hydrolase n=1 Tax=Arthrobacter sp. NPDC057013 TaxID=3345999 RepID=UPI00363E1862
MFENPVAEPSVMVACDLDRTLIYSANAMKLDAPDHDAPSMVVSEVYGGVPLSFMTRAAEGLLGDLVREAMFVPVTTRTKEQFHRVRIPGRGRGYAVTTNGAVLLHNGGPDREWGDHIRQTVEAHCAPLTEVLDHLAGAGAVEAILRVRSAEDVFVYSIVNREDLSPQYLENLTGWCHERGWSTSLQGRKLYCVPSPVTKESAVAEIRRRMPVDILVAAGDSKLDAGILELADRAIRPSHGELEQMAYKRDHLSVTSRSGILAGEEILHFALAHAGAAAKV